MTRPETAPGDDADDVRAARGVAIGLLLSVPLWALIGLGLWYWPGLKALLP